jgi:hypothetical protein
MRVAHRSLASAALVSLTLVALAGCSRIGPTAPETGAAPAATGTPDTAPPPPSRLTGPNAISNPRPSQTILNWNVVTEQLVAPLVDTRVAGSRYELMFHAKSVEDYTLVSIKEYDQDVVDVTFGPHGIKFGEPVTLSVDFSGTAADPKADKWDGSDPVLYWLNEDTMRWEEVPGRTDWEKCRHVVQLEHFSRYVLGGKAGWRNQPSREVE